MDYPTVEHFYQAMKTADPEERKRIASLPKASQAKRAGHKPWQPKFDRIKVMRYALERKFAPGTPEAQKLIDCDQELVEWNYWHDTFWGRCFCPAHKEQGENQLGIMLTQIRKELLNGQDVRGDRLPQNTA